MRLGRFVDLVAFLYRHYYFIPERRLAAFEAPAMRRSHLRTRRDRPGAHTKSCAGQSIRRGNALRRTRAVFVLHLALQLQVLQVKLIWVSCICLVALRS